MSGKNKRYRFLIPFFISAISALIFLTNLDEKCRDFFIRTLPSSQLRDDVVILAIDDYSIDAIGAFPWTRDILADCNLELKLLGAQSVVFDLGYFDESPYFLREEFLTPQLKELLPQEAFISNDEYLASCLKASQNDTLAFAFTDNGNNYTEESLDLFKKKAAIKNLQVNDAKRIQKEKDVMLPIETVLQNATDLGFVNAPTSKDGYLRHFALVKNFQGKYYPQLILNSVLKKLKVNKVVINRNSIELQSQTETTKIPMDKNGNVILFFPDKKFEEYNNYSVYNVYRILLLEENFFRNAETIFYSNFFALSEYADEFENAQSIFESIKYLKDELRYYSAQYSEAELEENIGMLGDLENEFYECVKFFISQEYENNVLANLQSSSEFAGAYDDAKEIFEQYRIDYEKIISAKNDVRQKVQDAICIIGTCATSTTDSSLTMREENFPNVACHAILANMILNNDFIAESPVWICVLIVLALSFFYGILYLKSNNKSLVASGGVLIIFVFLFELLFFRFTRIYIPFAFLFASVFLNFIMLLVTGFYSTSREKAFLRSSFNRYLSPSVIDQIVKDPSKLNLGGESREMTAIFTDIKSFSTLSEKLTPESLVSLLNIYLTQMSDIILKYGGTIDKFEGDAIIAFFGAPLSMPNHAQNACRAALELKAAEKELNKELLASKKIEDPLFTRIGINSGKMVVGNMGTEARMNYTIMGNEVNLAARLEGVNKRYTTHGILISEKTRDQLTSEFVVRELDRVRVVGIKTPVKLFELLDFNDTMDVQTREFLRKWQNALSLFNARNYETALKEFYSLQSEQENDSNESDGPSLYYIQKCQEFIQNPPQADWDGVFNLSQK